MPKPNKTKNRETTNRRLEKRLKMKRRKTNATSVRTIYDLDNDKPNQKDIKIRKIITRAK